MKFWMGHNEAKPLDLAIVEDSERHVFSNTIDGIAFIYVNLFKVDMEIFRVAFQEESIFVFV